MATAQLPPLDSLSLQDATAPAGEVPSAFPSSTRAVQLPPASSRETTRSPQRNTSNGFMSKVVRAMSRDRTRDDSKRRGERDSATTTPVEEPRGRATNVREEGAARSTSVQTSSTSRTRSLSRGRLSSVPPAHFGGRGGAGNAIRSPSRGRQEVHLVATRDGIIGEEDDGIEEEDWEEPIEVIKAAQKVVLERSQSRGRAPDAIPVGRGGMGGMRSGSRAALSPEELERRRLEVIRDQEVEERYRAEQKGRVSYGRGGSGNHQG